jgi:hypothetical protein
MDERQALLSFSALSQETRLQIFISFARGRFLTVVQQLFGKGFDLPELLGVGELTRSDGRNRDATGLVGHR